MPPILSARKSFYLALSAAACLSGCSLSKMWTRKEPPALPKMLVVPFEADSYKIGFIISRGLSDSIEKKVEVLDQKQFQFLVSSLSVSMDAYALKPVEASTPSESAALREPPPRAEPPAAAAAPAPAVVLPYMSIPVEPPLYDWNKFARVMLVSEDNRVRFYNQSGVEFLVFGSAKEKKLDALEAGNIETAETADMKLVSLKTGETLLESGFQQGFFEIVTPDRIGGKFADKINRKFKEMRKAEKKRLKKMGASLQ